MTEDYCKHLELIQPIISRLSANSFTVKGWTITLTSALLALAEKDLSLRLSVIAVAPIILFWGQDAYYLRQERLFRKLYESVRLKAIADERDDAELFSMQLEKHSRQVGSIWNVFFCKSIFSFYGALLALVLVFMVYTAKTREKNLQLPVQETATASQNAIRK